MKTKNKIKLVVLSAAMVLCTGMMGYAVYAATNETVKLGASNKVSFAADKYVDATINIQLNDEQSQVITFEETNLKDTNQTLELGDFTTDKWVDVKNTESDIDKQLTLTFTIQNTSVHSDIDMVLPTIVAPANATLTTNFDDLTIAQGKTASYSYNFYVTGLDTVKETSFDWSFTLTASTAVVDVK